MSQKKYPTKYTHTYKLTGGLRFGSFFCFYMLVSARPSMRGGGAVRGLGWEEVGSFWLARKSERAREGERGRESRASPFFPSSLSLSLSLSLFPPLTTPFHPHLRLCFPPLSFPALSYFSATIRGSFQSVQRCFCPSNYSHARCLLGFVSHFASVEGLAAFIYIDPGCAHSRNGTGNDAVYSPFRSFPQYIVVVSFSFVFPCPARI